MSEETSRPRFERLGGCNMKEAELKTIGTVLYWCEGTRAERGKNYDIEFVNSDPEMIKLFVGFLEKILQTDMRKLRGRVKIHRNQNLDTIEKFWSKISGIPLERFTKPIIRNKDSIKESNGTFTIRYSDKKKYEELISLINVLRAS
jgi:hypothetical protein